MRKLRQAAKALYTLRNILLLRCTGALVAAIQAKIQSKGDFPLVEFYESLDCDKDEWFLSEEQLAEIAMKAFGKWLKGEQ